MSAQRKNQDIFYANENCEYFIYLFIYVKKNIL